jgi:DNA invertase Pin-like site-specific DNA recombinase
MKLVNYIRVSTQKQGESGLGLEAQEHTLAQYQKTVDGTVIKTYREIESGKNASRPELAKAIAHAKRIKARLVIAKLDRLARNVHFISGLMETGVDFVNAESPNDDKFTIHIKASMAEDEGRRISKRTKEGLAAAKRRGTLLGSARPGHWDGREAARLAGAAKGSSLGGEAMRAKIAGESAPLYDEVMPMIRKLNDEGDSLQEIADALNEQGFTTLRGLQWNKVQISRLLKSA